MALRVLLADESTTIKKVMQLALQDFAVEVKSVQSGVDVVEVAKSFAPDIIFVDVLLQKKNGYEVCADVKRENALSEIPLVLMWSSFMDLDERQAQSSGCDRRLEKPFDVENLRQIVLELVPKTRSQRLAHFLKFPENLTDGLKTEETARGTDSKARARADELAHAAAKAEAMAKTGPIARPPTLAPAPPPVERQTPPPVERQVPKPPPVRSPIPTPTAHDAKLDEDTRRGIPLPPPPPAQISMPSIHVQDDQSDLDLDNDIIHDHGADLAPPRAAKKDEPRSNWNMESFEEIQDFSSQSSGPELVRALPNDHDDDAGFKEVRIASAKKPAHASLEDEEPTGPIKKDQRKLTPEDRDPWSHQDLARFKLDLPPIESEDGDNRIHLDVEGMEPGENSDFLHRREATGRQQIAAPASNAKPGRASNVTPPTIELEDYNEVERHSLHDVEHGDEHGSGSGITSSGIDIDDLEIEEEIPHDPGLSLHEMPMGENTAIKKATAAIPSLDADRLEEIIRAQSREIIEAVVRRIVPDLATDIIRKELSRLLDDKASR